MPPHVLVVDSFALVACAIAAAIEAKGAHVSMAASFKAAAILVMSRSFDMAILDADINGTSSEGLARTLASGGTMVVICSTAPSPEAAWMQDFITLSKPIDFNRVNFIADERLRAHRQLL